MSARRPTGHAGRSEKRAPLMGGLAWLACGVVLIAALCAATPAAAQTFQLAEPGQTPGWVFTPTFVFSSAYDDNVILAGHRAPTESDTVSVLSPSGDLQYRGRHNWLGFGYAGSISLYRQLSQLNSYDQTARLDTRHQLSRRFTLLLHEAVSFMPTTDAVTLTGVPFLRTGSRLNDSRADLHVQLAPHTTATAEYSFEWVSFDTNLDFSRFLHGGRAHGVSGTVEQQLSHQWTVGGSYSFRRAIISDNAGQFDIQEGMGTTSFQATPTLLLSGGFGFSRLRDAQNLTSRTGPSWRASAVQQLERVTVSGSYFRSYVPSFGLGGTLQNEELDATVRMPLAKNRFYWQGGLSWRRNAPLTPGEQSLRSLWFQNWVGYSIQRWLRIEGYFWRSQQDSLLPGGRVDRDRVGIQVVTALPMRLQ